jgi:Glycosyltransferase like family
MIVFATAITKPDEYERFAKPGIHLAREPDSEVITQEAAGSIFRNYNLILEEAGEREDLEALVLVHQDAEIVDPDFCPKIRRALSDPEVGVVGCVGAIGVRSIAWWEGSVTWASFVHRHGRPGEEFPSLSWDPDDMPPYARLGEVDTVDGFVMGLSPWTVRNIRFDEELGQLLHGYDFDFCLQVREAGRKVVTADLRVVHNHSLELANDPEGWVTAHMTVAEKWDGRMPNVGAAGGDWKQRARRAEAERGAARAQAISTQLQIEARASQHERDLNQATESIGWRITAPVRRVEALLESRRRRRA